MSNSKGLRYFVEFDSKRYRTLREAILRRYYLHTQNPDLNWGSAQIKDTEGTRYLMYEEDVFDEDGNVIPVPEYFQSDERVLKGG